MHGSGNEIIEANPKIILLMLSLWKAEFGECIMTSLIVGWIKGVVESK